MTAPAREFDGFPLAVGEVYGIRVWKVDDYGRLRARHVTSPAWRPGVNTAVCQAPTYTMTGAFMTALTGGRYVVSPAGLQPEVTAEQHVAPDLQCKCGFYAYTAPVPASYESGAVVTGIIRGTGRTLIGTKGFRCEKAEIVALLDPRMVDDYLPPGSATVDGACDCPDCRTADTPYEWQMWAADQLRALYPQVPLLGSRAELVSFAPIQSTSPDPASDEFWTLP